MLYLEAGQGYWNTTGNIPIGLYFRRTPSDLVLVLLVRSFPLRKGCNVEYTTKNGDTIATHTEYVKTR